MSRCSRESRGEHGWRGGEGGPGRNVRAYGCCKGVTVTVCEVGAVRGCWLWLCAMGAARGSHCPCVPTQAPGSCSSDLVIPASSVPCFSLPRFTVHLLPPLSGAPYSLEDEVYKHLGSGSPTFI